MSHIPHVTVATNLETLEDAYRVFEKYVKTHPSVKINLIKELVQFPSFYAHDPLQAYGWYVRDITPSLSIDGWKPHMSVRYEPRGVENQSVEKIPTPTTNLTCFLAIADTFSDHPCDWNIIYRTPIEHPH